MNDPAWNEETLVNEYAPPGRECSFAAAPGSACRGPGAGSGGARAEHVIDEPVALMLPNGRVAKHTLRHEHVVGRLEHPLEVRRVALGKRELLGELVQRDAPGEPPVGTRDLEQPVEASRDGGAEGPVARRSRC